jgi:hypothetical protein
MGWAITTNDNKYQIKYGNNINYAIVDDDVSYLTITDTNHIGINNNNPDPRYLLDINGETRINSNLHIIGNLNVSATSSTSNLITSNIIGYGLINNSNTVTINYTSATNYSNNTLKIYGQTSNYGEIYVDKNLNVKNNIKSSNLYAIQIYGKGSNITDINADNISIGTLNTKYGGTGLNQISRTNILFGGLNNTITQATALKYEDGTLYSQKFEGAFNIGLADTGTLLGKLGGTGMTTIIPGAIPFGEDDNHFELSPSLSYNKSLNTLTMDTLNVSNIIIKYWDSTSKILIDRDGVISPLNFRDVGLQDATSEIKGILKVDEDEFNVIDGKLSLRGGTTASWFINQAGNNLIFPSQLIQESAIDTKFSVGINLIFPKHTLDVSGDINTSNGTLRIIGRDIITIIQEKIDLKAASRLDTDKTTNLLVSTDGNRQTWKIFAGTDKLVTFEASKLSCSEDITANKLIINNIDVSTTFNNTNNLILIKENNITKFKFTKAGRLIIGPNIPDSTYPDEVLVVDGNIHASGHVRSAFSDNRLKRLTSNITGPLDIIDSLKGFYYVPNEKALELGFDYDNEIGLSAQDVQNVIPEIVKLAPFDSYKKDGKVASKSGENYLTICYERLSAVFVEAIKELRIENNELKKEIKLLKKDIDDIKKIIYIN